MVSIFKRIMAKRIVTKVGDIFCVEVDGKWKIYFRYVCNDMMQLNSDVIEVFSKRYDMDAKPTPEEIVADEVMFYAHTALRVGIERGVWYKYGKDKTIDEESLQDVLFGTVSETSTQINNESVRILDVNPLENWRIWHISEQASKIGELPERLWDKVEYGAVMSYRQIYDRIKYGYYRYTSPIYEIVKRIPHPYADSYTKREDGDNTVFLHFKGADAVQRILVHNGNGAELSEGNPLNLPKFWETNWRYDEFITEDDFNDAWRLGIFH